MQEISNSLRQRLGARPEPQEHPDPDVLTAYSEQLLPAAERMEVVLHLAQCGYCREVVSLSLPPMPPEQVGQPAFTRSQFWIPAFRWGAAVAMLAIAATLVVEKPWKQTAVPQSSSAQVSSAAQNTKESQPALTASAPAPTASTTMSSQESSSRESLPREPEASPVGGLRGAAIPEARVQQRRPAPSPSLGAAGAIGFVQNGAGSAQLEALVPARGPMTSPAPMTPPPVRTEAASESAYAYKSAGQDYVNTNVLKNESTFTSGGLLTAADASKLPQAPAARSTNGLASDAVTKPFPPISSDVGSRAFAVSVVPPNTAPTPASGPPDFNTLKSSKGVFRVPSKVGKEIVSGIEKAGSLGGQPSGLTGFSMSKKPNLKLGDNESEGKAERVPLFHINSDGILMESTDHTKWHEAYPQSSDLQLKVLVTRGDHVWAGGNNATLIHSWNGGVQWETLKVPDSGDITSITIDDGWQVRTSNGQTFVSQDKGKTWVPLQAEPK